MKLIEKHEAWMKKGRLSYEGLCYSVNDKTPGAYWRTLCELFLPSQEDIRELASGGYSTLYWGSGLKAGDAEVSTAYTPLRQTIVLLICAMHDEL